MRIRWLFLTFVLLGVSLVGWAIPTPKDTGALDWFVKLLSPCFEIKDIMEVKTCIFEPGCYCLYYSNDPKSPKLWTRYSFHGFGWYPELIGCGALYTVVRGAYYKPCSLQPVGTDPAAILPPKPAWTITIPSRFEKVGFWLNSPTGIVDRDIKANGLYYTCSKHNRDGKSHAYVYLAEYRLVGDCYCYCEGKKIPLPPEGRMYLIFWEDGCEGGDYDWDDFVAALIPCKK